jgi:hypothetical protein
LRVSTTLLDILGRSRPVQIIHVFVTIRSRGFIITTTANVALNATFTKCIFKVVNAGYSLDLNCPNHSGNYNINFSISDCVSNGSLVRLYNSGITTNSNAGGIAVYNSTSLGGFCVELYQSNTSHPAVMFSYLVRVVQLLKTTTSLWEAPIQSLLV